MIAKIIIHDTPVMIRTPHDDPDGTVKPEYVGLSMFVNLVKMKLSESYGFYGHLLDPDAITNLDLNHALVVGKDWEVEAIAPKIEPSPLPDGAVT